ncbi:hypothetical protein [Streptomyces monomycini]|uniref:hypothetical protein n=1 Tax=Streptomyces monomycini TaxID=371720 RepID=UPI0004AA919C|nr:hypothetical protein [Streptomyces monomycini]
MPFEGDDEAVAGDLWCASAGPPPVGRLDPVPEPVGEESRVEAGAGADLHYALPVAEGSGR